MIDLIITAVEAEAGVPVQVTVTVTQRYSPLSCTLSWDAEEFEVGFVAALREEAQLQTVILVGDRFFARSPRQQRVEFVARLRRSISRQMKASPWGRYEV